MISLKVSPLQLLSTLREILLLVLIALDALKISLATRPNPLPRQIVSTGGEILHERTQNWFYGRGGGRDTLTTALPKPPDYGYTDCRERGS